jgi:hypothetical protein
VIINLKGDIMGICVCSLANTKACENCNNNIKIDTQFFSEIPVLEIQENFLPELNNDIFSIQLEIKKD